MTAFGDELAEVERAYRKARWAMVGHVLFLAIVCGGAIFLRRIFKMPPALLGVAIIVALVVFGGDIMNFMRLRDRRRRLAESGDSHS